MGCCPASTGRFRPEKISSPVETTALCLTQANGSKAVVQLGNKGNTIQATSVHTCIQCGWAVSSHACAIAILMAFGCGPAAAVNNLRLCLDHLHQHPPRKEPLNNIDMAVISCKAKQRLLELLQTQEAFVSQVKVAVRGLANRWQSSEDSFRPSEVYVTLGCIRGHKAQKLEIRAECLHRRPVLQCAERSQERPPSDSSASRADFVLLRWLSRPEQRLCSTGQLPSAVAAAGVRRVLSNQIPKGRAPQ